MQQHIRTLPTNLQIRIATYAHPTLPKTLREAIHNAKLFNCTTCMFAEQIMGDPDKEYWTRECSCPARNKIFKSLSMEDQAHDRRCEEKEREDRCQFHTKKFKLFLEGFSDSNNRQYFHNQVLETIVAEASPQVQADDVQMMAFCASVYQRKIMEVLCSEAFRFSTTVKMYGSFSMDSGSTLSCVDFEDCM